MGDRTEHRFFAIWTALVLVLLIAGFAPTFYLRPFSEGTGQRELSWLVILHGALFTGWIMVFATQVYLAATGRIGLHRKIGQFAPIAIAVLVISAIPVALANAARADGGEGIPADVFLLLPLCEALFFGLLSYWAYARRTDPHVHKRLMLFALAVILGTGTGRLFGGMVGTFFVPLPFILSVWVFDWWRHRRIARAVLAGGFVAIAAYAIPLAFGFTAGWRTIAARMIEGWQLVGA